MDSEGAALPGAVATQSAHSSLALNMEAHKSHASKPTQAERIKRLRAALQAAVALCRDQASVILAMQGEHDGDLSARLLALAPVLQAQQNATDAGLQDTRSSRHLVSADMHVMGGAARHSFKQGVSFVAMTPTQARRDQHASRVGGSSAGHSGTTGRLSDTWGRRCAIRRAAFAARARNANHGVAEDDFSVLHRGLEAKVDALHFSQTAPRCNDQTIDLIGDQEISPGRDMFFFGDLSSDVATQTDSDHQATNLVSAAGDIADTAACWDQNLRVMEAGRPSTAGAVDDGVPAVNLFSACDDTITFHDVNPDDGNPGISSTLTSRARPACRGQGEADVNLHDDLQCCNPSMRGMRKGWQPTARAEDEGVQATTGSWPNNTAGASPHRAIAHTPSSSSTNCRAGTPSPSMSDNGFLAAFAAVPRDTLDMWMSFLSK